MKFAVSDHYQMSRSVDLSETARSFQQRERSKFEEFMYNHDFAPPDFAGDTDSREETADQQRRTLQLTQEQRVSRLLKDSGFWKIDERHILYGVLFSTAVYIGMFITSFALRMVIRHILCCGLLTRRRRDLPKPAVRIQSMQSK